MHINATRWLAPLLLAPLGVLADTPRTADPTYFHDIAPIIGAKCLACHGPTHEGAPFSLASYDDLHEMAELVQAALNERDMPPITVDASGSCRSYSDTSWITDEQIAKVSAWVDAGAPAGDPNGASPVPPPENVHVLSRIDAVVRMKEAYTPPKDREEVRCFIVDDPVSEDRFMTGFNVVTETPPGVPPVKYVHHAILSVPTFLGQFVALFRDLRAPGEGYPCSTFIDRGSSPLAIWAPGLGATVMPESTGILVPANRKLILQVHYSPTLSGGQTPVPFATRVELQLEKRVWRHMEVAVLGQISKVTIPPLQESFTFEKTFRVTPKAQQAANPDDITEVPPFTMYGVGPHMHLFGHDLTLEVTPAGSTQSSCVVDSFRWDFNHQRAYFYSDPIKFNDGDQITLRCHYNTMSTQNPVPFGEGSDKEMCVALIFVVKD